MSFDAALQQPLSMCTTFYASDAWTLRKQQLDHENEKHKALMNIGNAIIKAISMIQSKSYL